MLNANLCRKGMMAAALLAAIAAAHGEPGDEAAVAKARKEYEEAMKGHDAGLQNATKIQLAVQLHLAKARQESAKKNGAGGDAGGSGKTR